MKRHNLYFVSVILFSCGCTATDSNRFLYGEGQAWQRQKCYTMPDQNESKECLNKANTNYDDYKDKTEQSK